jgi:hypothetical protein
MGDDYVPASRARNLVTEAIAPLVDDFTRVRPGVWARALSDEIQTMLTLDAWKGAALSVGYGISCSWIPMRAGDRDPYHWPATRRQMRKHLFVDHFTVDEPKPQYVSHLRGERALRDAADAAVREAADRAERWWATVESPNGVLLESRRQAANPYDVHHPRAQLVVAFTLARLDQLDEARNAFGSLDLAREEDPETAQRLAADLRGVAERSRPSVT